MKRLTRTEEIEYLTLAKKKGILLGNGSSRAVFTLVIIKF